jgi:hypothetical protein
MTNNRHTVDPNGSGLLSFIKLFPNVEDLAISCTVNLAQTQPICPLERTSGLDDDLPSLRRLRILLRPYLNDEWGRSYFGDAIPQLVDLFHHLPLRHLHHLDIFIQDLIDSSHIRFCFVRLISALEAMRFVELEFFHLGFVFEIEDRPSDDLWVSLGYQIPAPNWLTEAVSAQGNLEEVIECALQATPISRISLRVRLNFDRVDNQTIFTTTNDDIGLDPAYLPSRDTLIALIGRIRRNHSQLKSFKLAMDYSFLTFYDNDIPEDNKILDFEYRADVPEASDHWRPLVRDNMDLRSLSEDTDTQADSSQYQYAVFPSEIRACYEQLWIPRSG